MHFFSNFHRKGQSEYSLKKRFCCTNICIGNKRHANMKPRVHKNKAQIRVTRLVNVGTECGCVLFASRRRRLARQLAGSQAALASGAVPRQRQRRNATLQQR